MELKFFDRFSKNLNIKFYQNRSSGSWVVPSERERETDGRTDEKADKHDKAKSRFSRFCDRA
jgi:hypothetical protein